MIFILLLLFPLAVSGSVPEDAFPGVAFDAPLEEAYATGEGLALKGEVADEGKVDGQILFKFTPRSGGDDVRVFLELQGRRFAGYQIFAHDQADSYDLEVYLGGAGESSLGFVGRYDGLQVTQGAGTIYLPVDFFAGIRLERELPTTLGTGEELALIGAIDEASKADGQVLFNFVPASGGDELPVYALLDGVTFSVRQIFQHDQAGRYDLEVYLGGGGETQLSFVGRYAIRVEEGSGSIEVPIAYFPGLVMDEPLPTELTVGRAVTLSGALEEGVRAFRIELSGDFGERHIQVGVDEGRFSLPLRLEEGEVGELELRILLELEDGSYRESGSFPIRGSAPAAEPRLLVGSLGVSLLAGEEALIELVNEGDAALEEIVSEVEGPFSLIAAPAGLAPGERGELRIGYDGTGGEEGLLRLRSDDPQQPLQTVALFGVGAAGQSQQFTHLRADAQGRIELEVDFTAADRVLVLYSGQMSPADPEVVYPFTVGGALVPAKPVAVAPPGGVGDRIKQELRWRERELAKGYRHFAGPAARIAAVDYQVGDRREFIFPGLGEVADQRVSATVVAVEEHAVGWVQDDLRADPDNLDSGQIGEVLAQFSDADFSLVSGRFGASSDVDGDGKLSFLFTHLVDDVGGVAGFYAASSVIPEAVGGDGNMTDMMFISPTAGRQIYRPLLVHEFQHLINFNQHVLVRRGEAEVSWLNEGLSHLSEDLVAGHVVSGQSEVVRAFLSDPSAVGLAGEALMNGAKRGAAYLFVRSLVDRLGEGLPLRLVGTGLADRDNVEAATGESFSELIAFWGSQLYASGLEVNEHPRFNYASTLLRAGEERGFPLPAVADYRIGAEAVRGSLHPRGLAFVRLRGSGLNRIEVETDPQGEVGGVLLPVPRGGIPVVYMPADYIPGLAFAERVPGVMAVEQEYTVSGRVEEGIEDLLLRFVADDGGDTLRFEPTVADGAFAQTLTFARTGTFDLQIFTGTGGARLDFAGGFGPVRVVDPTADTAVTGENAGLPGRFALGAIYPNPFNATGIAPVEVPEGAGEMALEIFDILGRRVRVLHRGTLPPGRSYFTWRGIDDAGRDVASGVYLFRFSGGNRQLVRTAVLVR